MVLLLLVLPTIATAQPLDLCPTDPANLIPGRNCTMRTPALNCTVAPFDYDIFNETGSKVVADAPLFPFGESADIFVFNFTLVTENKDFMVRLCDGSVLQVSVGGGPVSFETGSALLYIFGVVILGGLGVMIHRVSNDEQSGKMSLGRTISALLMGVKNLFILSIVWFGLLGINLANSFAINAGASQRIVNGFNTAFTIYMWLSVLATIFVLVAVFIAFLRRFMTVGDPRLYKLGREENEIKGGRRI